MRELLSVEIVEDLNKVVQTKSPDDFVFTNAKSILTLITTAATTE